MIDLSTLNPEQRQAVETTEGALLVLAGAGTGKTRVVVHRIAYLLQQGVHPEAILAVTFTNKAAAEMRERVAQLTRRKVAEQLTVSTFHAFGLQLLRQHIGRLGYRKRFAIFDTADQLQVVRRVCEQVSIGRDLDHKRLLSAISRAKNAGISPEQYEAAAKFDDDYEVMLCELYPRYQRSLKAMAAVDFDDLIVLPTRLLEEHESVRDAVRARYAYFMVDEYQDTSAMQVRFLEGLCGKDRPNLCVVGDDDQSIYAWRGAEVENILRFERRFPGAREVKLVRNYRSTANILDAANAVIAGNSERRGKDLITEDHAGEPIDVVTVEDDDREADWVVDEIDRLRAEENLRLDDVAILYRTNGQSQLFEETLRAHGHDYKVVGGPRFFDRKEVRDGVSYLRAAVYPRDDVSLSRIVNFPARGIGDTTLERLGDWAATHRRPLWDAMKNVEYVESVDRATPAVMEFVDLMERHRQALRSRSGLAEAAQAFFEEAGLYEGLRQSVKSSAAAEAKVANLQALVRSIASYESRSTDRPSIAQYLTRIALEPKDDDDDGSGKATLLTLHAAKGLEFPVVFLVGLEEGLLPHEGMQGEAPNMPEERRLAYVGITRARRRLYLTRSAHRRRRGRLVARIPSRFLEDLPEHAIRLLDATQPHSDPTDEDMEKGRAALADIKSLFSKG